jgi:alpha-tubulin suppressor-like RCC1 family protein
MWGHFGREGNSTHIRKQLTNIKKVFSNTFAFAALTNNGNVITWGYQDCGGNSELVKDKLKNVKDIFATSDAFAALTEEGSVVTWGNNRDGGDSSRVKEYLTSGVECIYSNCSTFIAVKTDDTIISWGLFTTNVPPFKL